MPPNIEGILLAEFNRRYPWAWRIRLAGPLPGGGLLIPSEVGTAANDPAF